MLRLFNTELAFWRYLRMLTDLAIASLCFCLSTLSLVGIAPGLAASSYAIDRSLQRGERGYFYYWHEHFKQHWRRDILYSPLLLLLIFNQWVLWPEFLMRLTLRPALRYALFFIISTMSAALFTVFIWQSLSGSLTRALQLFFSNPLHVLLALMSAFVLIYISMQMARWIWPLFIGPGLWLFCITWLRPREGQKGSVNTQTMRRSSWQK